MDNYTPNEIKDLEDIKQRVMRNVVQEIENGSRRPKYRWRFIIIAAVLTIGAVLFVLNQLFIVDQHSATKPQIDLTQPIFYEEEGLFYLHGLTLGDSKSKVVGLLGEDYTTELQEDGSNADLILDYEGEARFYFYQGELDLILLMNINEDAFEKLFNEYNGMKFASDGQRYLYSSETSHLIKAEFTPMGNLYLYFSYAEPEQLKDNAGYLKLTEDMD